MKRLRAIHAQIDRPTRLCPGCGFNIPQLGGRVIRHSVGASVRSSWPCEGDDTPMEWRTVVAPPEILEVRVRAERMPVRTVVCDTCHADVDEPCTGLAFAGKSHRSRHRKARSAQLAGEGVMA